MTQQQMTPAERRYVAKVDKARTISNIILIIAMIGMGAGLVFTVLVPPNPADAAPVRQGVARLP